MAGDEAMRDRIVKLVAAYPGLHLRELARQADTSLHLVQYHVQRLQDEGLLEVALDGGKVRVFLPGERRADRGAVGCLRDRKRLRIALVLLEHQVLSHGQLAARLKLGKSTLSFHLRLMEEAQLLQSGPQGYRLVNPGRTKALLERCPPTPDASDRLADVWHAMYQR